MTPEAVHSSAHPPFRIRTSTCSPVNPIGLKGGPNGYAYFGNSALRFLDPLGMDEWCGLTDGFFG